MKIVFLPFLLILLTMGLSNAQDWANFEKFRADNEVLGLPDAGEQRVVFMGNSITEGWGHQRPEFFAGKPWINRGIGGQTTPQMLVRFRADVVSLKPHVVIILAGTNDIAGNTGPSTIEMIADNIMSMAEIAQANGIKVIISSVLPVFDYPWKPGLQPAQKIVDLNGMMKIYASKNDMIYLDYFTPMADVRNGLKPELGNDGVHPNTAGYAVMEPLAEAAIKQALMSTSKNK